MTLVEVLGYVFAILMGLSLGVIGGGGSILTVPILVYCFKQDALIATTSSLFVVGTTALVGATINARRGLVDFKTGLSFAIPSFLGVFFARKAILPGIPEAFTIFGGVLLTKSILILLSFAIVMILASRAMIKSGKKAIGSEAPQAKHNPFRVGVSGFLVGCTTGFVGAGGGFLIIPALVILLKVPMRIAVGTSLAIITANSLFGFAISLGTQVIDWRLLLSITALGAFGLLLGLKISSRFNESKLKQGFGYFVLIIGSLILVDQILKMK